MSYLFLLPFFSPKDTYLTVLAINIYCSGCSECCISAGHPSCLPLLGRSADAVLALPFPLLDSVIAAPSFQDVPGDKEGENQRRCDHCYLLPTTHATERENNARLTCLDIQQVNADVCR